MKLADILSVENIIENLQARDQMGLLQEFTALFVRNGLVPEGVELVRILKDREDLGSTGIGDGVAIPHVRVKRLSRIRMAVGRSPAGVDFHAIDGRPVHIFFLLVAPENSTGEHLKTLARISRLLKKPNFKHVLLEAGSGEEMLKIIVSEDEEE